MFSTFASSAKTTEGINPDLYAALQRHGMATTENLAHAKKLCAEEGWNSPLLQRLFGNITPEKLASAGFAKPISAYQNSY